MSSAVAKPELQTGAIVRLGGLGPEGQRFNCHVGRIVADNQGVVAAGRFAVQLHSAVWPAGDQPSAHGEDVPDGSRRRSAEDGQREANTISVRAQNMRPISGGRSLGGQCGLAERWAMPIGCAPQWTLARLLGGQPFP
jgi:hypothetical protein